TWCWRGAGTGGPQPLATDEQSRPAAPRPGRLVHHRFHARGPFAEQIRDLFRLSCRRHALQTGLPALSSASFRRPGGEQLSLFDDPAGG
ncbi:MAG: hypothetical protein D6696_05250, partial [Acidobacteria bacterium]